MKKLILFAALLAVPGCEQPNAVDQCRREELFQACMHALPAGPASTKYNDWSEVVSECDDHARYTSVRARANVPAAYR